jgi:hypothetical protein
MYETNQLISNGTHKILLYTDIHLQLRMAYEKQAYWFTDISKQHFDAPSNIKQYMRQILKSAVVFNGTSVDPVVPQIVTTFNPAQQLRLEDLLTNQLVENFPASTQTQTDFLKFWRGLQPAKTFLN